MLCQGEVKLSTTSRDGRALMLKVAQPGEILGLSSCISGSSPTKSPPRPTRPRPL